ncbi:MAG: sodium-dependent transporter, partial [Dongiaceae bacterium]
MSERWGSRTGFILATIGSAVGLGSVWKFPYEVGENGGAGFLLFYLLGLVLVVAPLLLAEFVVGRRGQADAATSVARVAAAAGANPRWHWIAWLGILAGFLLLSYYAVIAGMTLAYTGSALWTGFDGFDAVATQQLYGTVVGDPILLALCQAGFLGVAVFIVSHGIGGGIETACKILMPVLIALMLSLSIYAAIEGDVPRTIAFLFQWNADELTPRVALEALGLGFFSIGVGLGLMITYAGYAGTTFDLGRAAWITLTGDTAISIIAGMAIFPLVFRYGLDPAEGVGLMFVTLPIAFGRLPFGDVVATAFFLLLFVAALASALSLLELVVAPLHKRSGWSRPCTTVIAGIACWVAGLPSLLSFNLWSELRPLA